MYIGHNNVVYNFKLRQLSNATQIEVYLQDLAANDDRVSLKSAGETLEGRDLWVVSLTANSTVDKPAVWIDCGIHARE